MTKHEFTPSERLKHQLKQIEKKPVQEVCVFTSKHKTLFKRFHAYRRAESITQTMRELIDIGLKSKGY